LPEGLDRRLQALLDKQDRGAALSLDEQAEAEGLVDPARGTRSRSMAVTCLCAVADHRA